MSLKSNEKDIKNGLALVDIWTRDDIEEIFDCDANTPKDHCLTDEEIKSVFTSAKKNFDSDVGYNNEYFEAQIRETLNKMRGEGWKRKITAQILIEEIKEAQSDPDRQ